MFLIGASGFLGSNCAKYLEKAGHRVVKCNARLEKPDEIRKELLESGCKHVICAAGLSGHPIIDWCEAHPEDTYTVNYLGFLNLMEVCKGFHLTIFGSGYVYTGAKSIYTEDDTPDLLDKVYCKYKARLEQEIKPHVLYLRIMYPTSFDGHPRCFYQKTLSRKGNLHNAKVSITSIPHLFPKIPELLERNTTGIFNFVIDGTVSLKEFINDTSPTSSEVPYGNYELSAEKLKQHISVISNSYFLASEFFQ
jgi:UDP-glucose 4,6-dehydratase